jgi:hypothetical protein
VWPARRADNSAVLVVSNVRVRVEVVCLWGGKLKHYLPSGRVRRKCDWGYIWRRYIYIYIYIYTRQSSWNQNSITLKPHRPQRDRACCLCYRPAVFFCHFLLFAFSLPQRKIWLSFQNVTFSFSLLYKKLFLVWNCIFWNYASRGVSAKRNVTSCQLVNITRRFGGAWCFQPQGKTVQV